MPYRLTDTRPAQQSYTRVPGLILALLFFTLAVVTPATALAGALAAVTLAATAGARWLHPNAP